MSQDCKEKRNEESSVKVRGEWVTPITAGAFLVVAVTGVLMFFHIDIGLNKVIHEWLGWALLIGAGLHVISNFKGFKRHLGMPRGQKLMGMFVLVLLLSFVGPGKKNEPPFVPPIRALSAAPLSTLAQVAQISPEQLRERLEKVGLRPSSDQQSLSDLAGQDMRKQVHILSELFAEAK